MSSDSDSSESPVNMPPSKATPEKSTFGFTLPDWFLSDNVKTAKQLREAKPKIRLSRQKNQHDYGVTVKQNSDHPPDKQNTYRVCHHTFFTIRDTLSYSLLPDPYGKLPKENFGVLISCRRDESREILAAYTEALAKEFDATLITLSIDDVQALALEFADQKPEDPNKVVKRGYYTSSLYFSLLPMSFYFASKTSETASKSLSGLAYKALSTAGDLAEAASAAEQDGSIDSAAPATIVDHPLIIHVEETKLFLEMDSHSERVIDGLKEFVIKERKKGRSIILVMTSAGNVSYSSLSLLEHSAFLLKSVHVPLALKSVDEAKNGPSAFFMRKLKLCLRFHARQYLDSQLLLPRTQWNLDLDENCEKFKDTNDALLVSLVSQITGRAHGKPQLSLRDVVEVLHQVSASRKKEAKDQHEDTSEDEIDEESGHTSHRSEIRGRREEDTDCESEGDWDDSEDHARCRDLNKYEKALVSSIVNTKELQDTKYEDVILNGDTKAIMKQLIILSKTKITTESSMLAGLQIKGALLYGPPGTGKTHFSRAIANCLGSNMLALDGARLQCKYVGETEKYINAAFSLARKYAPCILFFDEVDALFYRRSSSDRSWQRTALTQFLGEMDGITSQSDAPFVLVATNRPTDLDGAFLRRLPQKILFDLPDEEARAKILRVLLHEKDLHPDVDLDSLAARTERYSGSDLKNLCGEAALLWMVELAQKATGPPADHVKAGENGHTAAVNGDNGRENGTKTSGVNYRSKKKNKDEDVVAVEALAEVCLTPDHFDRALAKMQPTVSVESQQAIEGFAQRFHKTST